MSWAIHGIERKTVAEAKKIIEEHYAPKPIRDYIIAGIDGLVQKYGADVFITVTGYGHLCDSPTSSDPTTATIEVRKG